ncbi:MAG: hypothetical protein KJ970_18715 [Candidatus Eisenbacteria bacterium]|uniref:Uncharacterized protein n=1 Tax=Eiseniibacteriota bacterium TaxID=2212470 RepID=A0A948RY28_UNCEI|nr:hypothetical protein [Candidatus Eisenbacteria bacterium]MBU1949327.1 hypothetical protein [Candidatus Eisenbacteria bacterium]MBU2692955.1 hypothetical protein [Candidatus Eisenbacteria bacterium]
MLQALWMRPNRSVPGFMEGAKVLVVGHAVPGGGSGDSTISHLRSTLLEYRERGYRFCQAGELSQDLTPGRNGMKATESFVVALEGGCRCQRDYVWPLLKAMHIPVTLFLNPNRLGDEGMISSLDLSVLLREGVRLGGLWDTPVRLESLCTPDAAWNLELFCHTLMAHLPRTERKERDLWLALPFEKGDERIVTLARAAGFTGVVDGVKVSRPHRLSRQLLKAGAGSKRWWFASKQVFQGVCPGGR